MSLLNFSTVSEPIVDLLHNRVRLLVLDDDSSMRGLLDKSTFDSPLFECITVAEIDEARAVLSDSRRPFHVWILDYYLKRGVGLDLLKEFPDFQYSVLLSAVESMEIAGKAKDSGVFATFDKVVGFLSRGAPFFPCVCGLAALGFLHNGGQCGNLAIFRILLGHTIRTPEQWASIAYISTRQLTNICIKNTGFPPAALIAFYYAVFRLLINTPPVLPDGRPDYQTELFFIQCAKRVVGKIDKIKAVLQQLPIQELHEVHRIETILV